MLPLEVPLFLIITVCCIFTEQCVQLTFTNNPVYLNNQEVFVTGCINSGSFEKLPSQGDFFTYSLYRVQINNLYIPYINEGAIRDIEQPLEIEIYNNNFTEVRRGAFLNLPKLYKLRLSKNNILTVAKGVFTNLPALKTIHLHDNHRITSLPHETFENLPELEEVFIEFNKLEFFDQKWFRNTPKLKEIDISNNLIRTISRESFVDVPSVQKIHLYSNQIYYVDYEAFVGITNLTYLDLSRNKLKEIHINLNDLHVATLMLASNKLTYVPQRVLDDLRSSIVKLNVFGNPFQCSCYDKIMEWSIKHQTEDPFKGRYCANTNPVCVFPENGRRTECIEHIERDLEQELTDTFYAVYKPRCINRY